MDPDLSKMPLCDQQWDALEPLGDGRRFCTRCRHPVTDFRGMTKAEISMLHVMSDERVCGVYSPEQLAPVATAEPRRCRSPLVTLALGASLLAARAEAQAADRPATGQAQLPADGQSPRRPTEEPAPTRRADAQDTVVTIRGTVRDKTTHAPIPQAIVLIEGTSIRGLTDSAGGFTLRATERERVKLRVGRIGYLTVTQEVTVRPDGTVPDLDIMAQEVVLVGMIARAPRPDWQKVGYSIGRIDLSDR